MSEESLTKKTISGTVWVFGEKILAQAISFVVSIFLARLLFPDEYGVVALSSVFISISTIFVDVGMATALVQKKNPNKIDYSTVFSFGLTISIILYIGLFFLAKPLALFFGAKYNTNTLVWIIRLMALSLPIGSYSTVLRAYTQKNFLFKKLFWGSFFGTLLSGIAGILSAYLGVGAYALVIQSITDAVIDIFIITLVIKWFPGFKFSFKSFKPMFNYGYKVFLQIFFDRIYHSLSDILIGKVYSSSDLAFFSKGKQIPNLIGNNVEDSIGKSLFPAMSLVQNDREKIKKAIRKSIEISSYVIFPMLVGLICVGEPLIMVLFTERWIQSTPFLVVLSISFFSICIQRPIIQAILASGKSSLHLVLDLINKAIGLILLFSLFKFGVIWVAVSIAFSSFFSLLIYTVPCKRMFGLTISEILSDVCHSFVLSILMGVTVYSTGRLFSSDLAKLIVQIVVGIAVYLLLSAISKNKQYIFLKKSIVDYFHSIKKIKEKSND